MKHLVPVILVVGSLLLGGVKSSNAIILCDIGTNHVSVTLPDGNRVSVPVPYNSCGDNEEMSDIQSFFANFQARLDALQAQKESLQAKLEACEERLKEIEGEVLEDLNTLLNQHEDRMRLLNEAHQRCLNQQQP